jgi:hypothetical protein
MTSRRESLEDKMKRLQAQILAEDQRQEAERVVAEAQAQFALTLAPAVQNIESGTGISLRALNVGLWAYYDPDGALQVRLLAVGEDALPRPPAAPRRRSPRPGEGYVYYLSDGRGPFDSTLEALDALGIPAESRGRYYHRWDRLPQELKEQIERRPRPAPAQEGEA